MTDERIAEIGITEDGRLYVRPSSRSFEHIYRAAMDVAWDRPEWRLVSPIPREWSYGRWFAQIVAAAANEYGVRLRTTTETVWRDVPEAVRAEIEAAAQPS